MNSGRIVIRPAWPPPCYHRRMACICGRICRLRLCSGVAILPDTSASLRCLLRPHRRSGKSFRRRLCQTGSERKGLWNLSCCCRHRFPSGKPAFRLDMDGLQRRDCLLSGCSGRRQCHRSSSARTPPGRRAPRRRALSGRTLLLLLRHPLFLFLLSDCLCRFARIVRIRFSIISFSDIYKKNQECK